MLEAASRGSRSGCALPASSTPPRSRPTWCRSARRSSSTTPRRQGDVQDRRLCRGRPGREQALERVAGRPRADRAQEGREGRGRRAQRHDQAQDRLHQGAVAALRATRLPHRFGDRTRDHRRPRRATRISRPARSDARYRLAGRIWRGAARASPCSSTSSTARGGSSCWPALDGLGDGDVRAVGEHRARRHGRRRGRRGPQPPRRALA